MADAVPSEKLRKYLSELKPEARALLAAELERALLRGDEPPGAALILEQLRSEARNAGRKMPRPGHRKGPAIRNACSSCRSSRSWSMTRPPASIAAASRAPPSTRSGPGCAAISRRRTPRPMSSR